MPGAVFATPAGSTLMYAPYLLWLEVSLVQRYLIPVIFYWLMCRDAIGVLYSITLRVNLYREPCRERHD